MANRIGGLTHREIAAEFGISERRVNTEIQRALSVFRCIFREYERRLRSVDRIRGYRRQAVR